MAKKKYGEIAFKADNKTFQKTFLLKSFLVPGFGKIESEELVKKFSEKDESAIAIVDHLSKLEGLGIWEEKQTSK